MLLRVATLSVTPLGGGSGGAGHHALLRFALILETTVPRVCTQDEIAARAAPYEALNRRGAGECNSLGVFLCSLQTLTMRPVYRTHYLPLAIFLC